MAFSMKMGELSMDNTPIYQVDTEKGVMGQALNNGSILIDKHLSGKDKEEVIKHEKVHLDQMSRGDLDYDGDNVYWKGKKYPRSVMNEGAKNLPWEKEAYNKTTDMKNSTKNTPFYKTGPSDPIPKEKQPKAKAEKKEHHPGYEKSTYGKSFEPIKGDDAGAKVANLMNKRAFSKDSISAKKRDLSTKFPAIGERMQSRGALSNYIARSISPKTGDYTVSRKGDFPSNTSNVSRRDVAISSREPGHRPRITKNKKR